MQFWFKPIIKKEKIVVHCCFTGLKLMHYIAWATAILMWIQQKIENTTLNFRYQAISSTRTDPTGPGQHQVNSNELTQCWLGL